MKCLLKFSQIYILSEKYYFRLYCTWEVIYTLKVTRTTPYCAGAGFCDFNFSSAHSRLGSYQFEEGCRPISQADAIK
jgi:hypothetical protein